MGMMDGFKIRAALAKHQKGDISGAKQDYEALISQGILKPAFLLPYSFTTPFSIIFSLKYFAIMGLAVIWSTGTSKNPCMVAV